MDWLNLVAGISCALLASPDWQTREATAGGLTLPLANLAAWHPDPEVHRRAGFYGLRRDEMARFLAHWESVNGPLPWIDSWPGNDFDKSFVRDCWDRVGPVRDSRPGDWTRYREATRLWLLESSLTWESAAEVLRQMKSRCDYWAQNKQYPWWE